MISPTTDVLEAEIRAIVAAGSGLDFDTHVLPGKDSFGAPNDLYATVLMITDPEIGTPSTTITDDGTTLEEHTTRTVSARYSVQWVRKGARDAARRFAVWRASAEGLHAVNQRNLTVLPVSGIRQLDTLVDEEWEERVGMDVDIGYLESLTQAVDGAASTDIDIDLHLGGASVEELEITA